jgi:hypothetical protein
MNVAEAWHVCLYDVGVWAVHGGLSEDFSMRQTDMIMMHRRCCPLCRTWAYGLQRTKNQYRWIESASQTMAPPKTLWLCWPEFECDGQKLFWVRIGILMVKRNLYCVDGENTIIS